MARNTFDVRTSSLRLAGGGSFPLSSAWYMRPPEGSRIGEPGAITQGVAQVRGGLRSEHTWAIG